MSTVCYIILHCVSTILTAITGAGARKYGRVSIGAPSPSPRTTKPTPTCHPDTTASLLGASQDFIVTPIEVPAVNDDTARAASTVLHHVTINSYSNSVLLQLPA